MDVIGDGIRHLFIVVALWALAISCASKSPSPPAPHRDGGDAAITIPASPDARPATPAGTIAPYRLAPLTDAADLTVRVEWKDATAAQRTSPGRDPCGNARPALANVHTLHGVADAVVWLDLEAGKPPPAIAPATVTLRDCALAPAVQVAGRIDAPVIVRGADERRAAVTVAWADALTAAAPATIVARAELVVVGDTIALPIDRPWVAAVTTDASSDPAYVVVPPHPYVAITDETGAAVLAEVPPGTYPVHAWLRGGDGAPARVVDGEVTIDPRTEASVTLSLGGP